MNKSTLSKIEFLYDTITMVCKDDDDQLCQRRIDGAVCDLCKKQVEAWHNLSTGSASDQELLQTTLDALTYENKKELLSGLNKIACALVDNATRKGMMIAFNDRTLYSWERNYQESKKYEHRQVG